MAIPSLYISLERRSHRLCQTTGRRAGGLEDLPAHKVTGIRAAIEAAGAHLLYLPPYSPDFNPIEMAFSKLKALLRKAAARTVDDLWDTIANCLDAFKPDECVNYFAAAGYDYD